MFRHQLATSIAKALRTKHMTGKSHVFMAIVCLGYLSGILQSAGQL